MGETPGDFDSAILTTAAIMAARGDKHPVPVDRPYAFFVEPEHAAQGGVVEVATLFLTNSECPFRCLMCDLWRNTLDGPTPTGVIPQQIRFALTRLPPATHLKLYNSGNFFDRRS
ncbi:MAG: radical SAM protein, partial [Planctomycetes bacterium]|nr:radical SAM protein [Planctomycetota bacterium]